VIPRVSPLGRKGPRQGRNGGAHAQVDPAAVDDAERAVETVAQFAPPRGARHGPRWRPDFGPGSRTNVVAALRRGSAVVVEVSRIIVCRISPPPGPPRSLRSPRSNVAAFIVRVARPPSALRHALSISWETPPLFPHPAARNRCDSLKVIVA